MGGARKTPDPAAAPRDTASAEAARKGRGPNVPRSVLALQRSAGNAAVNALLAGRMRSPGEPAVADIDAALREVRQGEPVVDTVEKGLRAAKAAGVPVDLEGTKPPAAALAVTNTGFGPESVPAKKPVPPPKPVPAVSPLGKAAAAPARPTVRAGPAAPGGTRSAAAPAGGGGSTAAAPTASAAPPATASAVSALAPPVPPSGVGPAADPSFRQVATSVKGVAKAKKAHPPASAKAKEAQDAALAPSDDLAGQAKAAKVDTMDAQQPGAFDKKAFIVAVKAAIEAKSPKTLKEADDYKESGKAGEVKGDVAGLVSSGKQGQAKDIEAATEAPPDQSKAVPKPVTPLAPEQPGPVPAVAGAGAAPKPAPPEQLNLAAGTHEANQEMAEGEVSEQQLAQSNEPQFQQALTDKQAAATHAQAAPAQYRQDEKQVVAQSKADAGAETASAAAGMHSSKGAALAALVAAKGKTKTKDEAKRAEVTTKIQGIFTATEADVRKLLDGLDPKVDAAFTAGEAAARQAFEAYVDAKMSAYKKDRYGGWLGPLRWAKDKLLGMPEKVNEFYAAGRELYLKQMDGVITKVADIVATDLTAAKQRIAKGRADITAYVKSLPTDLQKVGSEASKEIGDRFAQLESDVDAKQESVVDTLATKYTEARKGLDERIEALQAENKGLVDKAIGAIKAVINTIRELAAMLRNVLSRVAGVVGDIIRNPIGFLGNLIAGVKGGILKFKDNILDHLRKGLMSWLFGALAEAGVELPDKFDLMGIIKLLASLFGLTWTNIRNRLVKQIGEKAMAAVEKGVQIFSVLATQGVAGLWQMLLEKLGDIKEMILEQVKDFVITKIITAGITWLIGLLNPAAAFIKACKMIYDVVMFFVDNGSRILKFVNTVIDSVADIVKGNVSGVVNKINDVLGQMVPIIIGFLASLVGLGGIGQKIRAIVETLQKPITKALDFVIKTGLKLAGPIIRGIKGISGKVKAKVAAGKAYVKGKVLGGDDSAEGKQQRLTKGVTAGVAAANRLAGRAVGSKLLKPLLGAARVRYGLASLEPIQQGRFWAVHGTVSRMTMTTTVQVAIDKEDLKDLVASRQAANNLLKTSTTKAVQAAVKNKAKLTPDAQAKLPDIQDRLGKVTTDHNSVHAESENISKNRQGDPARVEALIAHHKDVHARCTAIETELKDLTRGPGDLQKEADRLFRGMETGMATAEELLNEDEEDGRRVKKFVIDDPFHKGLGEDLKVRVKVMKKSLDDADRTVTSISQMDAVHKLQKQSEELAMVATRATKMSKAATRVDVVRKTIDNIYKKTTEYGELEPRKTETALVHEAKIGKPWLSPTGHLTEVTEMKNACENAITELEHLKGLERGVTAAADEQIRRATERIAGFQSGLDVWAKRKSLYPDVWDDKLESRVMPGWSGKPRA